MQGSLTKSGWVLQLGAFAIVHVLVLVTESYVQSSGGGLVVSGCGVSRPGLLAAELTSRAPSS